ncbi:MAG: phosphoglycerate kinase [Alphaproteobacteria bacterium]|nr:phosphoglycerate kinase [Alphaproteobacteria bacterium]
MQPYTEADLKQKIILMRVDFNVPMKDGVITDTTRIDETLAGIRDIRNRDGKLILLSHWGRPKGVINPEMSLSPIADYLNRHLNLENPLQLIADIATLPDIARNMQAGDVVMVENLRFWAGEEQNSPEFAKQLAMDGKVSNIADNVIEGAIEGLMSGIGISIKNASKGERAPLKDIAGVAAISGIGGGVKGAITSSSSEVIYINDAFATAHRAHASTEGLAHLLPAYAGPLLAREVSMLQTVLDNPKRPLAAIVGGAKISSKITLLNNLVERADIVVITGGMANMFIKHAGHKIGASLCEDDGTGLVAKILATAKAHDTKLIIPQDAVVATEIKDNAKTRIISDFKKINDDEMILDAGPDTLTAIKTALNGAQTIIMNGPLGVFEYQPFAGGSNELCAYLAERAKDNVTVVAGGGDTVAAVKQSGYAEKFTYLSTAGGAFLEWLEGKTLPGIAALITE